MNSKTYSYKRTLSGNKPNKNNSCKPTKKSSQVTHITTLPFLTSSNSTNYTKDSNKKEHSQITKNSYKNYPA
jgi:hypothetical protein